MKLNDINVGDFFKWGNAYWVKMWHTNLCIKGNHFYREANFKNLSHKTEVKPIKKQLKETP